MAGSTQSRRPLLSVPAQDAADLAGLVEAGADAFYCGVLLPELRARLGNWAFENGRPGAHTNVGSPGALALLVRESHGLGCPVMLAMNRPYPETVRPAIEHAVSDAADRGVDGFILADLEMAAFLRRRWPHLTLVASTYMAVFNSRAIAFAADAGFDRVVLPRPIHLDEARRIARGDGPGLEVFLARERCRFVNAHCRTEHWAYDAGTGRMDFKVKPLCIDSLVDARGSLAFLDDEANMASACGMCAVHELAGLPRIESFKVVGRGAGVEDLLPFVRTARRLIDAKIPDLAAVRRTVVEAGLTCSAGVCHYPDIRTDVPLPSARPIRRGEGPSWDPPPPFDGGTLVSVPPDAGPELCMPDWADGARVGDETCVHLLPSPARLRRWMESIAEAGKGASLVLPAFFGDRDLRRGMRLVEAFAAECGATPRVTANDVGGLLAVREVLGPDAELSMGRLFLPQRTDARLWRRRPDDFALTPAAIPWKTLDAVAEAAGVRRIEMSIQARWPPTGGRLLQRGTLHLGPALTAVGRACETLADLAWRESGNRPYLSPTRCWRPCLGRRRDLRMNDGPEVVTVRGNALYFDPPELGSMPGWVDRRVVHASFAAR